MPFKHFSAPDKTLSAPLSKMESAPDEKILDTPLLNLERQIQILLYDQKGGLKFPNKQPLLTKLS